MAEQIQRSQAWKRNAASGTIETRIHMTPHAQAILEDAKRMANAKTGSTDMNFVAAFLASMCAEIIENEASNGNRP